MFTFYMDKRICSELKPVIYTLKYYFNQKNIFFLWAIYLKRNVRLVERKTKGEAQSSPGPTLKPHT